MPRKSMKRPRKPRTTKHLNITQKKQVERIVRKNLETKILDSEFLQTSVNDSFTPLPLNAIVQADATVNPPKVGRSGYSVTMKRINFRGVLTLATATPLQVYPTCRLVFFKYKSTTLPSVADVMTYDTGAPDNILSMPLARVPFGNTKRVTILSDRIFNLSRDSGVHYINKTFKMNMKIRYATLDTQVSKDIIYWFILSNQNTIGSIPSLVSNVRVQFVDG